MSNAEKFKEVFGFEPNQKACPFVECNNTCPNYEHWCCQEMWWKLEYKGADKEIKHETHN